MESRAKKKPPEDVWIGKFDILATYAYALVDGLRERAQERRMGARTVMGMPSKIPIGVEQEPRYDRDCRGREVSTSAEELRQLHDQAHHACFIANSVKAEIIVEPQGR